MGQYHYQWSQKLPQRWPWNNIVWEDFEEWVWWRIPIYSDACERDSSKLTQDFAKREIPSQKWGRNLPNGGQCVKWVHRWLAMEKDCVEDVWQRWCVDADWEICWCNKLEKWFSDKGKPPKLLIDHRV